MVSELKRIQFLLWTNNTVLLSINPSLFGRRSSNSKGRWNKGKAGGGARGVAESSPHTLSNQLLQSQSGVADYAHHITTAPPLDFQTYQRPCFVQRTSLEAPRWRHHYKSKR